MSGEATLTARPDASGRVALLWQGRPLVAAIRLTVHPPATAKPGGFGVDDRAVQHRADGGRVGWRIVRDGLDVRLTFGIPPDGHAAVFRLDVTNVGRERAVLALESEVDAAGSDAWHDVAPLHARTVRVADGLWLAHTFAPDDARWMRSGDAAETPSDGVPTEGAPPPGALRRAVALAPGDTQGWTVCVGVGDTARAALGAAFPHLSGQRSRAALAAAKTGAG